MPPGCLIFSRHISSISHARAPYAFDFSIFRFSDAAALFSSSSDFQMISTAISLSPFFLRLSLFRRFFRFSASLLPSSSY